MGVALKNGSEKKKKKKRSSGEAMGGVGRKSTEDRVHKSSGGGRETKETKMARGIQSSMERRVKELAGGLGQGRAVDSVQKSCFGPACLETGWVRDTA